MEGKKALITGSTSGIGLAIAQLFASNGCDVILNGSGKRPQTEIDDLKQQFTSKYKTRCEYISADFTQPDQVEMLCKTIDELFPQGIDVLINNAGMQKLAPVEDFPLEIWQDMTQIMLTAPFMLINHFLPTMKQKVALESGGSGVTCNAIAPGYVCTPHSQGVVEEFRKELGTTFEETQQMFLEKLHPSKASVKPEHIAEMCMFLCSEAGSQMTGAIVMMDGGWTAK